MTPPWNKAVVEGTARVFFSEAGQLIVGPRGQLEPLGAASDGGFAEGGAGGVPKNQTHALIWINICLCAHCYTTCQAPCRFLSKPLRGKPLVEGHKRRCLKARDPKLYRQSRRHISHANARHGHGTNPRCSLPSASISMWNSASFRAEQVYMSPFNIDATAQLVL